MAVQFYFEQQSDRRLVLYLSAVTPRMIAAIHMALKLWIYQGANISVTRYMVQGQSLARGARNTSDLLARRTGTLARSVVASVDSGMDPAAPSAETVVITAMWGASVPYARIQEYGGNTGRNHAAYLRPRPYLGPALDDQRPALLTGLEQAVASAIQGLNA